MSEFVAYQAYDIRDYIEEETKGLNISNLSEWNMSTEQRRTIVKMTKGYITGAKYYLANKVPFTSAFSMNVNTFYTFKLDAPMAVNCTESKHSLVGQLNLYINPFWLLYECGQLGKPFVDPETFEDPAVIILHELEHLLYNHVNIYKPYMMKGYGEQVNIATDCQINQDDLIAKNKNITDYGITLKSVEELLNKPLKPKESSVYYFEEIMKNMPRGKGSGQGQSKNSSMGQGEGGLGQGQGQNQGQGQGQSSDNDPYGSESSHKVWNETPEDCKDSAGGKTASKEVIEKAIGDAVQNAAKQSNTDLKELKSRGIVAGEIIDSILTGLPTPGKLPIKSVILKGLGKLKLGEKKTFRRPNPRQGNRPDIRRGIVEINGKNILTLIDNSGSMGSDEISWGLNEIAAIAKKTKSNLEVYPFDTKVYEDNRQEIPKNGKWKFNPVGRGGTCFQPCFDWLRENPNYTNDNTVIIFITDGYGESHVDTRGFKNIVWLLVEEKHNTLSVQNPIGQVAWLDQDNKYKLHKLNQGKNS